MKNIEEKIFDKVWNKLSLKRTILPSIVDENVRTRCVDMMLLPIMNQIVFNSTRSLVSGIKSKFK
jgi:hypothetical protein